MIFRKTRTAIFHIKDDWLKGIEGETAQRVGRSLLSEGDKVPDIFEVDGDKPFKIGDLERFRSYDVFAFITGTLFITSDGINILSKMALNSKRLSVIVPVSNESLISVQRFAPPFIYQTESIFRWVAHEIYRKFGDDVMDADEADDFCLVFRKELSKGLPADEDVVDLPQIIKRGRFKFGVAKGVYAHRYRNVYESGREDLLDHVPLKAGKILDIGCAKGLFGELLKKRQRCIVTGIDTDPGLIDIAKGRLDNFMLGDIGAIIDKGSLEIYDCIVCGDLIEHLNNPWKVVNDLKDHLKKGGLFIASTPNIMNWAILFDLLRGRWDYVPFSILSGTHIRFFTRSTLTELFGDAGYRIKKVLLQNFEIPPPGVEFIAGLKNVSPAVSEEELKASEIVVVAER
jgi:2-polyprenyl-3-methyl-5-hydroxy-6-metoxy-1,4-benzoquinol methylase